MSMLLRFVMLGFFAAGGVGAAAFVATAPPERLEALGAAGGLPAGASADAEEQTDAKTVPRAAPEIPKTPPAPPDPAEFLRRAAQILQRRGSVETDAPPPPGELPPPPEAEQFPPFRPGLDAPIPSKAPVVEIVGEGDAHLSITIQGEDIRRVLELLSEQGGLNILAGKSVAGTVSASLKDVTITAALDAILRSTGYVWRREGDFIYVGTPEDFRDMRRSADRIATRIYRPNYMTAADLQALITPLLTPDVGTISVTKPSEVGIASDTDGAGGNAYAGREALLVRDYETVLLQVDDVVRQLDCQPQQVAIEAMILSVTLDDKNDVGVDFQFLRNKTHMRISGGAPLLNMGSLDVGPTGLKVGFLDSNLSSFVTALEQIGDTNVIATPRLMCLNKHRAEIMIGEELGYLSTTQNQSGSTTQTPKFLPVGTQLRLRPFISRDGMIRLEVHPELSTGTVTIEDGFTIPNKKVTQVTTNVMVRDGSTVVIGGLLRDELKTTTTQIPLLGSLPVVGPLFRHKKEEAVRSEVLLLLTPRIVRAPQAYAEGEHAAQEFHHRHMNYADQMMPLGKRYIGRKYFRRAQQAWAAGQQTEALRLVNLSLHFDPLSRAALDLREDIATGTPVGDHTADFPRATGLLPGPVFEPPPETLAPSVEQAPAFRPELDSPIPSEELPPPDEADALPDPVVGPPLEPVEKAGE